MKRMAEWLEMQENEVNEIFNTGQFNPIMRGYFIMTMKNLNYTNEQIEEMIDELRYMLDMHTAGEAREKDTNWKG
jgi:hypothetical protein